MKRYRDGVLYTDTTTFEAVPDSVKNQNLMDIHRGYRDLLLRESDWTQANDSPLSNDVKTQWATYRQELRDISDLDAWPNIADDDWPVAP